MFALDLPEGKDTGCDLAPSCLNCPLPVCVEEFSQGPAVRYRHGIKALSFLSRFEQLTATNTNEDAVLLHALAEKVHIRTVYMICALGKKWRTIWFDPELVRNELT